MGVWLMMGGTAVAADQGVLTREDILRWIETTQEVQPAFSPGGTLTQADLDKLRPFLPPRYLKEFNFAGVEFPITASGDYSPPRAYLEATDNIGFTIIDIQKEQATIFSAYRMTYSDAEAAEVEERFDTNRLSEGRR
jgi:hypothetical protein